MQSTITVKGQATIPKPIRDHLKLKTGDRVKFFIHPDGTVVILPMLPASTLRGMLKRTGRNPVTIEEMDEGIAAAVIQRDAHSKQR